MNIQKKVVCLDAQIEEFDPSLTTDYIDIILQKNGFEVIHTPHKERGINAVSCETPDVVLLDLSNNHSSVWELYHQIRESTLTCNIPVILITERATRIEDIMQLYAANAADCLVKPFAPQDLLTSIKQVLLN